MREGALSLTSSLAIQRGLNCQNMLLAEAADMDAVTDAPADATTPPPRKSVSGPLRSSSAGGAPRRPPHVGAHAIRADDRRDDGLPTAVGRDRPGEGEELLLALGVGGHPVARPHRGAAGGGGGGGGARAAARAADTAAARRRARACWAAAAQLLRTKPAKWAISAAVDGPAVAYRLSLRAVCAIVRSVPELIQSSPMAVRSLLQCQPHLRGLAPKDLDALSFAFAVASHAPGERLAAEGAPAAVFTCASGGKTEALAADGSGNGCRVRGRRVRAAAADMPQAPCGEALPATSPAPLKARRERRAV